MSMPQVRDAQALAPAGDYAYAIDMEPEEE